MPVCESNNKKILKKETNSKGKRACTFFWPGTKMEQHMDFKDINNKLSEVRHGTAFAPVYVYDPC